MLQSRLLRLVSLFLLLLDVYTLPSFISAIPVNFLFILMQYLDFSPQKDFDWVYNPSYMLIFTPISLVRHPKRSFTPFFLRTEDNRHYRYCLQRLIMESGVLNGLFSMQ